jgi:hypothetical protein
MNDIVRCSRRQAELGERTALKVVKIQCVQNFLREWTSSQQSL